MPDVSLGRFSRLLEKFYNAKGGPAILDLQPSVQVTHELDKGVDQRYLESWNRFAVAVTVPGVASQISRVRIRNPVGSNVVAVIEQIRCNNPLADAPFVTWGSVTTDLATIVSLTFSRMDPRGNPQPTSVVSFNQQAAGGVAFLQGAYGANGQTDFILYNDQQIPNLPGQAIDIASTVTAQAITVTIAWRERALESSELT